MGSRLQSPRGRDITQVIKAIPPLPGSQGPSCYLWQISAVSDAGPAPSAHHPAESTVLPARPGMLWQSSASSLRATLSSRRGQTHPRWLHPRKSKLLEPALLAAAQFCSFRQRSSSVSVLRGGWDTGREAGKQGRGRLSSVRPALRS